MARASNSSEAHRPGNTVLVVDDSATIRMSVEMSLRLGGYHAVVCSRAAEALALVQRGLKPDLVLTDIIMPDMDGVAFIRAARQWLRFTPIVALTTQDLPHLRATGMAAGATAWLNKPTGGDQLLGIVARYLRA